MSAGADRRLTGVVRVDRALGRLRAVAEAAGVEGDLRAVVDCLAEALAGRSQAEARADARQRAAARRAAMTGEERERERLAARERRRARERLAARERRARSWAEQITELAELGTRVGRRRAREIAAELERAGLVDAASAIARVGDALAERSRLRRTEAGRVAGAEGVTRAVAEALAKLGCGGGS